MENTEKVVYEIVDDEHPENNAIVDPNAKAEETLSPKKLTPEALRAMALLTQKLQAQRVRAGENQRALDGRVRRRRTKNKLAKASRKRNRKG